jgi:hypothetical protein
VVGGGVIGISWTALGRLHGLAGALATTAAIQLPGYLMVPLLWATSGSARSGWCRPSPAA